MSWRGRANSREAVRTGRQRVNLLFEYKVFRFGVDRVLVELTKVAAVLLVGRLGTVWFSTLNEIFLFCNIIGLFDVVRFVWRCIVDVVVDALDVI